tara:strand:+ start:529 stop:672 length:144 start_codon:yes stop_codon:yes gene_type:complete
MNLKEAEKKWQENLPIEANGMIKKRSIPKRWAMKIQAHNKRKKIENK